MTVRWYYRHANQVFGPVLGAELKRLAAGGAILAEDLIWPESGSPSEAVELRAALDFSTLPPRTPVPAWLGDVQADLQPAPQPVPQPAPPKKSTLPGWLTDLEPVPPKKSAVPAPEPQLALPVAQENLPVPQLVAHAPPQLRLGGATSVGRVRPRNEDRFLTQLWSWNDGSATHEVALLVVADGMGGYQGGEEASSLTVRTVAAQIGAFIITGMSAGKPEGSAIGAAIDQAIREANNIVRRQADANERFKGMGATAAVVLIWDDHVQLGHVGDCRVYLHRGSALKQLTEDQTLVARMVALGQLTPEEAAQHENRNEVTQAVGRRSTIDPSRADETLMHGDTFVVACDGLAAHVDQTALHKALNESLGNPSSLADHLVGMADAGGGTDNCTVVVARY